MSPKAFEPEEDDQIEQQDDNESNAAENTDRDDISQEGSDDDEENEEENQEPDRINGDDSSNDEDEGSEEIESDGDEDDNDSNDDDSTGEQSASDNDEDDESVSSNEESSAPIQNTFMAGDPSVAAAGSAAANPSTNAAPLSGSIRGKKLKKPPPVPRTPNPTPTRDPNKLKKPKPEPPTEPASIKRSNTLKKPPHPPKNLDLKTGQEWKLVFYADKIIANQKVVQSANGVAVKSGNLTPVAKSVQFATNGHWQLRLFERDPAVPPPPGETAQPPLVLNAAGNSATSTGWLAWEIAAYTGPATARSEAVASTEPAAAVDEEELGEMQDAVDLFNGGSRISYDEAMIALLKKAVNTPGITGWSSSQCGQAIARFETQKKRAGGTTDADPSSTADADAAESNSADDAEAGADPESTANPEPVAST